MLNIPFHQKTDHLSVTLENVVMASLTDPASMWGKQSELQLEEVLETSENLYFWSEAGQLRGCTFAAYGSNIFIIETVPVHREMNSYQTDDLYTVNSLSIIDVMQIVMLYIQTIGRALLVDDTYHW